MTGDEVRATWFLRGRGGDGPYHAYSAAKVDSLLQRIAAELDAGLPIEPLIENAAFREMWWTWKTYDRDAVEWFLDQLLLRAGDGDLAGPGDDPWRDLPVAQLTWSGGGGPDDGRRKYRGQRQEFAEECQNAWRDFGQQPGTYLRWGQAGTGGLLARERYVLRTTEQQTIAFVDAPSRGFPLGSANVGERRFRNTRTKAIPEIGGRSQWARFYPGKDWKALLDEAGTSILYTGGANWEHRAAASVIFPDGRWLRFPVRGTGRSNAIMTAVDQAGTRVARYRYDREEWATEWPAVEIAVHPGRNLTDELVLAIAKSAGGLGGYFKHA